VKAVEGNRTPGRFARAGGGRIARSVPECVQSSGALGSRPPASEVRQYFIQRTMWPGINIRLFRDFRVIIYW
jgi:hypothetical protein